MSALQTNTNNPFKQPSPTPRREEWEDWEDDEVTMAVNDGPLIDFDNDNGHLSTNPPTQYGKRNSSRYSVQRPMFRAKSKGHQKAKIVKAGIKLDTDVSKYRQAQKSQQENPARFADAAALKALEGSPNSASIGSFSWLKQRAGKGRAKSIKRLERGPESDLSPDSRPIVIGIAVPEDNLSEHQVSPQTAVLETPIAMQHYRQQLAAKSNNSSTLSPEQLRSVWSPDTEASESPYTSRAASSIYSQPSMYGGQAAGHNAPPVPALPATYKFKQSQPTAFPDADDEEEEDSGTPCTLFEEDGSPLATRKSYKPKSAVSPQGTGAHSNGWWDTVTLSPQTNPFRQTPHQTGESSNSAAAAAVPHEWWQEVDEKKTPQSRSGLSVTTAAPLSHQSTAQSSQSFASSSQPSHIQRHETQSEKARILLEENHAPSDEPPPYSPPKAPGDVKYVAILPPSHTAMQQPIPSPGPMTPGLPGTMTSQGAIGMADIPVTPRSVPAAVLPDRPVGTYVTHDQFRAAPGTNNRIERNRRRHEKEEFVARKVGGFWRGRGCMPGEGCFGRTGREGRQRRRVCLGIIGGIIAIIILIVVLAVVLTRKSLIASGATPVSAPGTSPDSSSEGPLDTVWLNLTDFPPMPTGVLTVKGPDNSKAVDECLEKNAKTLWSCSIPKDQQDPKSLFKANQPEFIFQIQFDNNTRALWNITNEGEQPDQAQGQGDTSPSSARRAISSAVARAAAIVRRAIVYDAGFSPNPAPPEYKEMFFLGNTTDGVEADSKAGEPTPFFISLLNSTSTTVGPDVLSRRGIGNGIDAAPTNGSSDWNVTNLLPPPEMESNGTPAPARLFPLPVQQPVRLYDRGLPTEHYGFYTYFNKTIYIADLNKEDEKDADGGAALRDATTLVIWSQARFLVQIWTRKGDAPTLLNKDGDGDDDASSEAHVMPYPVTITEDFHGGNRNDKGTWYWNLNGDHTVNREEAALIEVDNGVEGSWINRKDRNPDLELGGIDGGTGGCKCVWVNFAEKP
ncbi:hypothetical protein JX265_008691 [Neoarthrinium moseri]|uniref:Glycoprotease family protein n=1 Tax=Neoarthrinium moseri TaxID=1658444 RepID=A0A9P9WI04_9PEZI|nr:uncharacterized protein JN550_013274 [Neoarthrinium moseri]KAI1857339.1 hypothetical protein JN550_013274 [Neoarthrinium moseri]KAI1864320.1 hypothetical protein JX265_008691 [Neoarthrinium moseri]